MALQLATHLLAFHLWQRGLHKEEEEESGAGRE
jgi:hypothetical protein